MSRAIFLALMAFCAGCSVYPNPHHDLVLLVRDADASENIRDAIRAFANRRGLNEYSPDSDSSTPEYVREINSKTTYYSSGDSRGEGRSITLFAAATGCKVVRVVERSRKWNAASQADFDALRTALEAIDGVEVRLGEQYIPDVSPGRGIDAYCEPPMAN